MTERGSDVRNSTLSALKLSCPSAEYLDPFSAADPMANPFIDAETEWTDEEELIPKSQRRRTQYVPPHITVNHDKATGRLSAAESYAPSSSEDNSPDPGRNLHLSVNGSPMIPPKSPSRPDLRGSQDDLVKRFYDVTRERDALRKELQRKSMGPNGVPRESVVYKSDEKTLIEELQALRYEIRIWSEEYFAGPLRRRNNHPHLHSAKDMFRNLSDNYGAYLKNNQDRPLLIQAYIWSRLQDKIFSTLHKGHGYVWAGSLGDRKLRPINDTLRKAVKNEEEAEAYHRWRAMTVNMLVPQVDGKWRPTFDAAPVLKRIKRFCGRLRRKLRPWATESLTLGKEQLHTIVSAAVALDLKMKRQRADYRFVTWTGGNHGELFGYPYYDSEMDDIDDIVDKNRWVELALAPALERCGNANGYVFDQSFILVKADVTCKRLHSKKKARPQASKRSGIRSVMNLWNSYA